MTIYKDFGFDFVKESSEGASSKIDEYAINQSIRNILFTQKKEVPFDPLFGSGIRNLLFEKMNVITEQLLKQEIRFALENHEPRIEINSIDIDSYPDTYQYDVFINYTIVYLEQEVTFNINLQMQGI